MVTSLKPWWAARWETVEPEEEERFPENDYNDIDPTVNEILDYEDSYNEY